MDSDTDSNEEAGLAGPYVPGRRAANIIQDFGKYHDKHGRMPRNTRRLRVWELAGLGAYWFGWSFLWMPLLIVIIPFQIQHISPDAKGSDLAEVMTYGSLISLPFAPIFGSLSDSSRNRHGRRRPFMVMGTILASLALVLMAVAPNMSFFTLSFITLSIANNLIVSPYSALVPDFVPMSQRGEASGWLGMMSMLGYIFGGMASYSVDTWGLLTTYCLLIFVHALSMAITCFVVEETPIREVRAPHGVCRRLRSFIKPFLSNDFRVVFFTRFVMQLGIITVQEYLQWYLRDAIGAPFKILGVVVAESAHKAVTILFVPVLFGAFLSSLGAGILSDRMGGQRKPIVYGSGAIMTVSAVMFAITRSYTLDMLLGLVFGIGFGAFAVMDWALATDVLPNPEEFAKDMGVWSLAMVLPQVIAAPVAGKIIDSFENETSAWHMGYTVVFLVAAGYLLIGTWFVKFVDHVA